MKLEAANVVIFVWKINIQDSFTGVCTSTIPVISEYQQSLTPADQQINNKHKDMSL